MLEEEAEPNFPEVKKDEGLQTRVTERQDKT